MFIFANQPKLPKSGDLMKISFNWLKEYIELEQSVEEIADILTATGLEVENIDPLEAVEGGLEGLVIGEVLTCHQHPNADKLKVTTVNIGKEEPSRIVCGAPNVEIGQKVIVAPVGTTLYPKSEEAVKIKRVKIRGEFSEGMICAEDEIGISTEHEGIMVLNTDLNPGIPAIEYFDFSKDYIIEIGLTPNRADANSHLGVARDLKAVLKKEVNWPSVESFKVDKAENEITLKVEDTIGCPRYSAVTISGVEVKESPEWLKSKLLAIGQIPINNIVDATNFVLHETGQPLHAFDADEITGKKVIVKTLANNTKFTTLDEKDRKLRAGDLMICNEKEGMCIAGVFGGIRSGITTKTKSVFLESAYFSADYIRKTVRYHGLKTDASFRFERGTDPNLTVYALKRAALIIKEIAGGTISSDIIDNYPVPIEDFQVIVKYKNIDRLIGKKIPKKTIFEILGDLEIEIEELDPDSFKASIPQYRVDVQREADVIEEILRIYGFDNVEIPAHISSSYMAEIPIVDQDRFQQKISALLVSNGFYEIVTNSLTKPDYVENSNYLKPENNVVILNTLSEDLGVMRQTMLFSGLETIAYNLNRKQSDLKLFEFGKTYQKLKSGYQENNRLCLYLTGNKSKPHWSVNEMKIRLHDLYNYVALVLKRIVEKNISGHPDHQDPFQYGLELSIGKKVFGKLGKVNPAILKNFGINEEIFYADLNWDLLLKKTNDNIVFEEVSKFPEVRRDLSLLIDKDISFEQIKEVAEQHETYLVKDINVFDVYEGKNIGENKKAYAMSFLIQDKKKTLTDKIIDKVMNRLMNAFENELKATIRK